MINYFQEYGEIFKDVQMELGRNVKGVRVDCNTGEIYDVELMANIRSSNGVNFWFHIKNGVTGYESFEITLDSIRRLSERGWFACAGTKGRWDMLYIEGKEMEYILGYYVHVYGLVYIRGYN